MATHTIYITDDDRFLLDMYSVKFKGAGNNVMAFQSGGELIDALRKDPPPEALILDLVMPKMDGFEVLETIKKDKLAPKMKIIILSNQGDDSDVQKSRALGADGYIIKASAIPSEVYAETLKLIS